MLLRIIISFLVNRIIGMSYIIQGFFFFHLAINSMISFWVHSLLPLLLLLFDIRLLPEQKEDVKVFITDAMLLTVTCSWLCTTLLEFCSMSLCKISFSYSPKRTSTYISSKENSRNIQKQPLVLLNIATKGALFCHVSMMWTFVDLFCKKRLFSQGTVFSPDYFTRDKNGFIL